MQQSNKIDVINESELTQAAITGMFNALNRVQAIIEFNLDGTVITANDNFLTIMGYSLNEIKGKHHRMFCEAVYANSLEYQVFWNKLGRGEFDSNEYKRIGKGGKEVWINASYNPIMDAHGKPFKVIKFATDITTRNQRNAEFEGKINALNRAQAVIEFDLEGTIISANENFLKTVGYTLEEIRGKHHRIFCEPTYAASHEYQDFWANIGRGAHHVGEFKRIGKGGKVIWINASYNPIFDANGKPFKTVKFATDISENIARKNEFNEIVLVTTVKFNESLKEVSDSVSKMAQESQSLGATTEEMSACVEELSASIDSIAQNVKSVDTLAKANHVEAEMRLKAINRSIEAMDMINKSSEEISEIVKVISEIASQTNLLAFNAAIEAARAGEHGLGFSVVADEVRKLAERSSQATKDISKLINESVKRIAQGGEISKEASKSFKNIFDGVGKTTQSISEISVATHEQQSAAKDVAQAIQQIADATENSATAADNIAHSTADLTRRSEQLKNALEKFS